MKQRLIRLTALLLCAGLPLSTGSVAFADEVHPKAELIQELPTESTGFAKCRSYINVRSLPDQEGDVIGKLYNNGSVEILEDDENGWYHIRSGNVEGYIASQFIATGTEALKIAQDAGYTTAEVDAYALNVRAQATEEAPVVGSASEKEKLEVVAGSGNWVKVVLPEDVYGYVNTDYVNLRTEYATALTLEEDAEKQRQLQEAKSEPNDAPSETTSEVTNVTETPTESDIHEEYEAPAQTEKVEEYHEETGSCEEYYEETGSTEEYYEETGSAEEYYEETGSAEEYYEETGSAEEYYEETGSAEEYYEETSSGEEYYEETGSAEEYYEETGSAEEYYEETGSAEEYYYEETEAPAATSSSTGQAIVDYACQFVGNPYVYGGNSLTNGTDCSGFTMLVFSNFGISLPRTAADQSGCGYAVSQSELQPGDLLFYTEGSGISHVAIYMGNDQIVHAANSNKGICTSYAYYNTFVCARRLV